MAHIGKDYRLHFRRDTATPLGDNRFAWGCKYNWSLHGLGGVIGGPLNNSVQPCVSTPLATNLSPIWSAPIVHIGAFVVQAYTYVVIEGTPQRSNVYGEIREATLGIIYKIRFPWDTHPNFRNRLQGIVDILVAVAPWITKSNTAFDVWDVELGYWP